MDDIKKMSAKEIREQLEDCFAMVDELQNECEVLEDELIRRGLKTFL